MHALPPKTRSRRRRRGAWSWQRFPAALGSHRAWAALLREEWHVALFAFVPVAVARAWLSITVPVQELGRGAWVARA